MSRYFNSNFSFPPLEKTVNLSKLLAVSVRCNLGRDPPEEEVARTNVCGSESSNMYGHVLREAICGET